MDSVLYPLFALMSQWMRPRFNVRMQLLEAQVRMLRSRVDATRIVPTPVRSILGKAGHFPAPQKAFKNPPIPWTTFVHAPMDSMIACDFFTKPVLTLRGIRRANVLVFLHLGSRRVFCSASTYHPDSTWVMQQARNATMWMEGEGIKPRFIIRDRDRKYPDEFDTFWKAPRVRPIKIPPRAPMANAFCESFIGTTKREVPNHFVCFSQGQLDYIVREWLLHYHSHRPHRGVGKDNVVLDTEFVAQREGAVRSRTKLGGILREYYRDAA